jgi:F5/8 type C domain
MVEEEYVVPAVTASGFQDPNKPENVIDNLSSTRWANQGAGSWIQLDLGEEKTPVRSVGIQWYKGNERRYNLVIRTSTDETNFQDVITDGISTGTTLDLERYNFLTDNTARYVRVIVNGNSVNNWASIHTSKIFSEASVFLPAGTDPNGIKKVYPDVTTDPDVWTSTAWKIGGQRTFQGNLAEDREDSRFMVSRFAGSEPKITISGDSNSTATVETTAGEGSPRVGIKGSWNDTEMTVYYDIATMKNSRRIEMRVKTSHYIASNGNDLFGGYILEIAKDIGGGGGYKTGFRKELKHSLGTAYSSHMGVKSVDLNPNAGVDVIGFKAICYNVESNVKLEIWKDKTGGINGGTWVKENEFTDTGQMLGTPVQTAQDGSFWRINGLSEKFIMKLASVRRIVKS